MKLWRVRGREHGLENGVRLFAQGLGSYGPQQTLFLIPIKGRDKEVDETAWGIKPSYTGKPVIMSNYDPTPGVILCLSSYNRPGKAIGRLYIADDGGLSNVTLVGLGVGGTENGSVTWEEAVVAVRNSATLIIQHTGPPDALVLVDGEEVEYREVSADELEQQVDAEFVRIDDSRVARWKAS